MLRRRVDPGNKSTAKCRPNDAYIAIFADISTSWPGETIFQVWPVGGVVPPGPMEDEEMQQVRTFLRGAPSRIGRRLAQIVAIAFSVSVSGGS